MPRTEPRKLEISLSHGLASAADAHDRGEVYRQLEHGFVAAAREASIAFDPRDRSVRGQLKRLARELAAGRSAPLEVTLEGDDEGDGE